MDDKPGGSVADRFVSSKALEEAKAKREAEWQDAYSRLGQEVPQELREQIERGREGDGRSLFDQLRENRTKKQEAFEEKTKLKNQFRPLDDEEIGFLDRIVDDTNEQEEERKKAESEQLKQFREAVIKKQAATTAEPPKVTTTTSPPAVPIPKAKKATSKKKTLPGLVVNSASKKRTTTSAADEPNKKAKA